MNGFTLILLLGGVVLIMVLYALMCEFLERKR